MAVERRVNSAKDDLSANCGNSVRAPEEFVITPEMIAAGADLLSDFILDLRDGFLSPSSAAAQIYRVMEEERELSSKEPVDTR